MQQIGLEAVLNDSQFQAGLSRYMSGLSRMEGATQRSAGIMTAAGHTISTAIGTAIGTLAAQAIPNLMSAITAPIDAVRKWGGQLDELGDLFGVTDEGATAMAMAFSKVGLSVDEGSSGLNAFIRNAESANDALAQAGSTAGTAMADALAAHTDAIAELTANWQTQQQEAADNIANIWSEFASRRGEIEADLADRIASIQDGLNEQLADIADERGKIERDTAKSLSKLEDDTKDRLRNARTARDRRQVRKDAAERKAEILTEAAERKAELDKQEARAREQAAKQIALAEKVAAKQIEAAEKAANKQSEAIEKALAKQEAAYEKQAKKEDERFEKQQKQQQATLAKAGTSSPFLKALKDLGLRLEDVTDESKPFEDRLGDIMDAFKKLPPGINASAIAMQLFGRSGTKYLDFLRMGRAGLEALKKEGIDLGLVLNPDDIKEYNQNLAVMGFRFDALGINIGKILLPFANDFVKTLSTILKEGIPLLTDKETGLFAKLNAAFKTGGFGGMIDAFRLWANDPKTKAQIDPIITKLTTLITDIFNGIVGVTGFASGILGTMIKTFQDWTMTEDGKARIYTFTFTLGTLISDALVMFVRTAANVTSFLIEMGGRIIQWTTTPEGKQFFTGIATAFMNGFNAAMYELTANYNPFRNLPGYGKEAYENIPSRQAGGPIYRTGLVYGHAGEYVLNRQQAMAWAPLLSRPNVTSNSFNFQNTWNGAASSFDRREVERIAEDAAYRGISRGVRHGITSR